MELGYSPRLSAVHDGTLGLLLGPLEITHTQSSLRLPCSLPVFKSPGGHRAEAVEEAVVGGGEPAMQGLRINWLVVVSVAIGNWVLPVRGWGKLLQDLEGLSLAQ